MSEAWLEYGMLEDALRAELAALKAANRWIPVEERLPENLQEVLFLADGDVYMGTHMKSIRQWAGDGLYWHDEDYSSITHWRYLPEPPNDQEDYECAFYWRPSEPPTEVSE